MDKSRAGDMRKNENIKKNNTGLKKTRIATH